MRIGRFTRKLLIVIYDTRKSFEDFMRIECGLEWADRPIFKEALDPSLDVRYYSAHDFNRGGLRGLNIRLYTKVYFYDYRAYWERSNYAKRENWAEIYDYMKSRGTVLIPEAKAIDYLRRAFPVRQDARPDRYTQYPAPSLSDRIEIIVRTQIYHEVLEARLAQHRVRELETA